jgi:hypothetical protein
MWVLKLATQTADKTKRLCNNSSANCCKFKEKNYRKVEIITVPYFTISVQQLSGHPVYYAKDWPQFYTSKYCTENLIAFKLWSLFFKHFCIVSSFRGFRRTSYPHLETGWICEFGSGFCCTKYAEIRFQIFTTNDYQYDDAVSSAFAPSPVTHCSPLTGSVLSQEYFHCFSINFGIQVWYTNSEVEVTS